MAMTREEALKAAGLSEPDDVFCEVCSQRRSEGGPITLIWHLPPACKVQAVGNSTENKCNCD